MHDPGDEHRDPIQRSGPEPWARVFARGLEGFANTFAMSYGGPFYLVGSALVEPHPYDVDIRVVIEKHDWLRLFGEPDKREGSVWSTQRVAWARDRLKQSRRLSRAFMTNIDFQVQRVEEAERRYVGKPRLRLDTIPDELFKAGLGDF